MSAEYATHRFFRASRQDPSQETWLERLMRDKLPEIAGSVPESRLAGICLLEDLGEFLTRLAHVSAEFAKTVVNGPIVSDYADDRINEDEFRDLEVVVYLDDKHMSLKKIATELANAASRCQQIWDARPSIPLTEELQDPTPLKNFVKNAGLNPSEGPSISSSLSAQSQLPRGSTATMADSSYVPDSSYQPDSYQQGQSQTGYEPGPSQSYQYSENYDSQSPEGSASTTGSDDRFMSMNEAADMPPIEQLKVRGKGHYTCPRGTACTKGGINSDGTLVVFERNSAYRAHLERHEKNFKCDRPDCGRGFARRDQLERHKGTKHKQASR